jgi:hypothetical protein
MRQKDPSVSVAQTLKSKFNETEEISIPLEHIYMNAHFIHFWDWDKQFNNKWLN